MLRRWTMFSSQREGNVVCTQPGYPSKASGAKRGGDWSARGVVQRLALNCRISAWAQRLLGHSREKLEMIASVALFFPVDELAPASSRVVGEAGPLSSSKVALLPPF